MDDAATTDTTAERDRRLVVIRRVAIAAWIGLVVLQTVVLGLAFDRTRLIILLCLGLVAFGIGRRRLVTVVMDWLPFATLLILYDFTRDIARIVGLPTHWNLAVDADHLMFGVNPTLWLQAHLKQASPPWWEVGTSVVYMSYFVVPYAVAAWLWWRNRLAWRRFAVCFLATSFLALIGYTVVPAAPPWATARCTAAQVADHPRDPACMYDTQGAPGGGLLGTSDHWQPGAEPRVERISARGWDKLGLSVASTLLRVGQGKSNLVAAIPSLHAGLTMLLALFMWPRVRALGRTLFVGYALAMAFTLVYTAEHFVIDILLGWALAAFVVAAQWWFIRRRGGSIADERDGPESGVNRQQPEVHPVAAD